MTAQGARPASDWPSILAISLSQLTAWGALYYSFPALLPGAPRAPFSLVAVVAMAVFGAGMGIKTIVQATAAAELIGRQAYGATQGALTIPALLAQAAAPFLSATVWI